MFSNEDVAKSINTLFEPVWQSVREVPILRLDFGNGNVITRTLHGNIATYVCTADGQVVDVLPGIYTPETYMLELGQMNNLVKYIDQEGQVKRNDLLKDYHVKAVAARKQNKLPPLPFNVGDLTKSALERSSKFVLMFPTGRPRDENNTPGTPEVNSKDDLANWKVLAEDTQVNETVRRLMVSEHLVRAGATTPTAMTKWLYKDVLHADLDDPYLGLGKMLFDGYVFDKEDRQ